MKLLNQTILTLFFLFLLVLFACELEKIPDASTLADFDYALDSNDVPPIEVTFTNQSINADTYLWDFGDTLSGNNNISNEENPIYTYDVAGFYNVTLTTTNSQTGISSSVSKPININCLTFQEVYNKDLDQIIVDLVQKKDGGYAMVGYEYDETSENSDVLLILCDKHGNFIEKFTFGHLNNSEAYDIVITPTDGFAIIGYQSIGPASNKKKVYLIVTDSTAASVSEHFYGEDTEEYVGNSITVTSANDKFAIAGFKKGQENQTDVFLIKANLFGVFDTTEMVYGTNSWEVATDILPNDSGGYTVFGHTHLHDEYRDYFLLFTGNDLTPDTMITYANSGGYDISHTLVKIQNGFALLGFSSDNPSPEYGWIRLLLTNEHGVEIMSKEYSNIYRYQPGWAQGIVNTGYGFALIGSLETNIYFTRIDYSGNEIGNAKTFGNTHNQYGYAIIQTSDGGFAIAGYTDEGGDNDALLIKTDPDGNIN